MKRCWNLSRFKAVLDHPLTIVLLAYVLLSSRQYHLSALVLCIFLYDLSADDGSLPYAVFILILFLFPMPASDPSIRSGRVISVRANYAIVQNSFHRLLVYTKELPVPDSLIAFDGTPQEITSSKGFWRFDFAVYMKRQGLTHSISPESITVLRPSISLRGKLFQKIKELPEAQREIYLSVLFNIREQGLFRGIFADRGFSLAGILVMLDGLLMYVLFPDARKKVRFATCLVLALVFHFPYLITQRLIYMILERFGLKGKQRTAAGLLIGMRLYPHVISGVSFLLPALFRFLGTRQNEAALRRLYVGAHAESILFHSVNPVQLLLYPYVLPLSGFLFLCTLGSVILGLDCSCLIRFFDGITAFLEWFDLPGTLLGFGLGMYLILLSLIRGRTKKLYPLCILFFIFQGFGLFHPLCEVTYINVGQGDSILLRGPFSTSDILIDTGKPSQWSRLSSFLTAKGIRNLDALIVTHSDKDHSGNQENVMEAFHPSAVLTEHHPPLSVGFLKLFDLNTVDSDDANESSIVTWTCLNGLKFLFMGDSSQRTERILIREYSALSADILKLSHHGSDTGSDGRFLDQTDPELAIISSGMYSIYHHPSPDVLYRLSVRRIPYLDTKEEGDISLFGFPGFFLLLTSSGRIAIIPVSRV